MRARQKPEEQPETFWPTHILQEAGVMLVVLIALILLVVFIPIPHEAVARPTDTSYIPRPEWYFLFLFQTLQYFPGELEVVGVAIVPGLAVLFLLLLPFLDRTPTMRPLKRPLASSLALLVTGLIVFLTVKGMLGIPPTMASISEYIGTGERWYQEQGCASCHTINGVGTRVGPDLAGLAERRTLSWLHKYLEDPLLIKPDSAMPGYLGALTHEEIEAVSLYLMSLEKTAAPTGVPPTTEGLPPTPPPATLPQVPHTLEGRSTCLACHQEGVGGATKIPADHSGHSNEICLTCHKAR